MAAKRDREHIRAVGTLGQRAPQQHGSLGREIPHLGSSAPPAFPARPPREEACSRSSARRWQAAMRSPNDSSQAASAPRPPPSSAPYMLCGGGKREAVRRGAAVMIQCSHASSPKKTAAGRRDLATTPGGTLARSLTPTAAQLRQLPNPRRRSQAPTGLRGMQGDSACWSEHQSPQASRGTEDGQPRGQRPHSPRLAHPAPMLPLGPTWRYRNPAYRPPPAAQAPGALAAASISAAWGSSSASASSSSASPPAPPRNQRGATSVHSAPCAAPQSPAASSWRRRPASQGAGQNGARLAGCRSRCAQALQVLF
jgi:hypothetical protein